jgi:hypothetical protein
MHQEHPRMKTVWCKTQLWELVSDPDVIWIDANSQIISQTFVEEASMYGQHGFATYKHPDRDCIYEEADASYICHPLKYEHQPIREQVAHYRELGHPEHWGLYAVGTCVYDTDRTDVRVLCNEWWEECAWFSYQTQLSLPFVARQLGFEVGTFNHHQIVVNPWMRLNPHLAET